jgi:acyl dehydratase
MESPSTNSLSLEDLQIGQTFVSESQMLSAEQIKAFAREFDPQPFHMEEEAAKDSFFGGLAASGWHTAALSMRMLVSSVPIKGGLIGAGGEISWTRPTRPGDLLHLETEITEIKPSRSRPERGMVTIRSVTKNQNGETVQILVSRIVVPTRNKPAG